MSNQYSSGDSKKKQNWILVGGIVGVVVFTILIFASTNNKQPQVQNQQKPKPLNVDATVTDNISDQEIYLQNTRQEIKDTKDQINDLQSKFQALQVTESNNISNLNMQINQQFTKINAQLEDIRKAPPAPIGNLSDSLGLPSKNGKPVGLPDGGEAVDTTSEGPGIVTVDLTPKIDESATDKSSSGNSNKVSIKSMKTYLPTSFVKAKLVTSIDAPCGGTAQDNPFPILLNVTDQAQLPNSMRTKIKGCFVLAAGYGDVASERAYFRTEKMSCVMKNGDVIDQKVEGYIVGEDGKAGLRGNLVSKAGSKVALALLSGTVGGLAQAFAQTATTLQQTPIGPTQTVTPSQSLGYAGATGVSSGFQQLSQYYINMAEKTFPVIEINDQRNVSIVFTQGIEFPVNVNNSFDGIKQLPISVN